MIDESRAVEIAAYFMESNGIAIDYFSHATHFPEKGIWSCVFVMKQSPDEVEIPEMQIIHVNSSSGEPSFYEML